MNKFWRGETKDGKFASEKLGTSWQEICTELKKLELVIEDKVIELPEGLEYIQAKTCGADLLTGECEIESRYIGFKLGNNNIIIRVDENSGNIKVEISQ